MDHDQAIAAAVAEHCGEDPAKAAEMVKILLLLSDDEEPVRESKDVGDDDVDSEDATHPSPEDAAPLIAEIPGQTG